MSNLLSEETLPDVTLELEDREGLLSQYGNYIQGHSRLHIRVQFTCPEERYILRTVITCGGITAYGDDLTFALPNAGSVEISVVIQLSDETTAQAQTSVFVLPYAPPEVTITALDRCAPDGSHDPQGSLGIVRFRSSVTELPGGNPAVYSLQYRPRGMDDWTNIPLSGFASGSLEAASAIFPADVSHDYEVRLRIADSLHLRLGNLMVLPVAFALADFDRASRAIGLGQRAGVADTLGIGLDTDLNGHRLRGLPEPEAEDEAVNLGYCRGNFWSPELLWENPSPDDPFPAAALQLSLSRFTFLLVELRSGENRYIQLIPRGTASMLYVPDGTGLLSRTVRSSDSGISFFSAADDSKLVPIRVYGIQEVT